MAEFQMSTPTPLVQVYLGYNVAPAQITYVRVVNTSDFPARGDITRNNGQKFAFTIPAHTVAPGLTENVNPAQYTCTVDADGNLDVAPNYNFEWPT